MNITETLVKLWQDSGFSNLVSNWQNAVMILVACILLYLAIVKKFEPLLLVCIAFGMLVSNLPITNLFHPEYFSNVSDPDFQFSMSRLFKDGGLIDFLYLGVKFNIYPSLIFMGIGAMTDFSPMLARPSSMLLGAAAQLGIYCAFVLALLLGFAPNVAASIGIIGGADGPTAIFLTSKLAPEHLGAIAVAAYSYMALIPLIQPPIMKLVTTKKEREAKMEVLRNVSKRERILFPIIVTIATVLLLPSVAPLLGMFMLGNLFRECGVVERLSETAQNALINIVTIFLGISVGATAVGYNPVTGSGFLTPSTLLIIVLGLAAFSFSTFGGLIFGKIMYVVSRGKINPLIGSAGVSAVPMAARVSQTVGLKATPSNFLLMHAMGPNVAGVIGSAVAAGFLLAVFGK